MSGTCARKQTPCCVGWKGGCATCSQLYIHSRAQQRGDTTVKGMANVTTQRKKNYLLRPDVKALGACHRSRISATEQSFATTLSCVVSRYGLTRRESKCVRETPTDKSIHSLVCHLSGTMIRWDNNKL
jgi:arginyl-tRNA--protein-N-Asp/Glu arginylyltransferase